MSGNILYLSVELELKIISSTGCNIILSGDHEFPARAKCFKGDRNPNDKYVLSGRAL